MSCGARELQVFVENASRNVVYTSQGAVVDFIFALRTWVEESILKRLPKASVFNVMADGCTVITAMEKLTVFCHWEEVYQIQKPSVWQYCRNFLVVQPLFLVKRLVFKHN